MITCNLKYKPGKATIFWPDGEGGVFSLSDIREFLDKKGLQNYSLEEFADDQCLLSEFYSIFF